MKPWIWILCAVLLASCAPVNIPVTPTSSATRSAILTPYQTQTPIRSATPAPNQPSPTPLATLTPTPRIHVVKTGEDLSGIALRYRVSLDALKTANPTINPRIIIVGQQIIVPAGTPLPGTLVPSATAVKIVVEIPRCHKDESGGAWCFTSVKNLKSEPVESVTVRLRLVDAQGKPAATQVTAAQLNLLQPGKSVPVGVYFPAPLPPYFQAAAELVNTLPVQNLAARYLSIIIESQKILVAPDQMSAEVSGMLVLAKAPPNARQTALVAVAYAADGNLVGVRRWENTSEWGASPLPFSLKVYAVGEKIARVDLLAEARP